MSFLLSLMERADELATESVVELRWGPATALFLLASADWVRGGVLLALGAAGDVRERRFPLPALWAGAAALFTMVATEALKEVFDRERPPVADGDVTALISLPHSASFPSGHASTSFAAATVIAAFHPRLRVPVFAVAVLVALSRVYLGVHYAVDVVAGAAFGVAVGLLAVLLVRRVRAVPRG